MSTTFAAKLQPRHSVRMFALTIVLLLVRADAPDLSILRNGSQPHTCRWQRQTGSKVQELLTLPNDCIAVAGLTLDQGARHALITVLEKGVVPHIHWVALPAGGSRAVDTPLPSVPNAEGTWTGTYFAADDAAPLLFRAMPPEPEKEGHFRGTMRPSLRIDAFKAGRWDKRANESQTYEDTETDALPAYPERVYERHAWERASWQSEPLAVSTQQKDALEGACQAPTAGDAAVSQRNSDFVPQNLWWGTGASSVGFCGMAPNEGWVSLTGRGVFFDSARAYPFSIAELGDFSAGSAAQLQVQGPYLMVCSSTERKARIWNLKTGTAVPVAADSVEVSLWPTGSCRHGTVP